MNYNQYTPKGNAIIKFLKQYVADPDTTDKYVSIAMLDILKGLEREIEALKHKNYSQSLTIDKLKREKENA